MQYTNNYKNTIFESEDQLQAAVIQSIQDNFFNLKELVYHIYNNPRNKISGAQLKAKGLKDGMPDLCLALKTELFGALYIELKLPGEKPKNNQLQRHLLLRAAGNKVVTCDTVEGVLKEISDYTQNVDK